MTIYSIVILILLLLFLVEQRGITEGLRKRLFYVSAFCLFFISAFRGENVGGDMIEYVHFWQGKDDMYGTWKSPNELLSFEPGLSWLCYFLHIFNDGDAWFFVFCTSFLTLFPFFYLVWRDSYYKVLPILLFTISWGLLDISFTGLRQVIGVSLCVAAYAIWTTPFKEKGLKYMLTFSLLLFSLSFHTVVYFTILFFLSFLIFGRLNKILSLSLLLSTLVFGIVFAKVAPYLFEMTGSVISSIDLLFRLNHYFEGTGVDDGLKDAVIGIQQILTVLVVCIIIVFSSKEKNNSLYANCLTFGCSLFNIFVSFPNAGRFLYPLMFVGFLVVTSNITVKKNSLYKVLLVVSIAILSIHQIRNWENKYEDKSSDAYVFNQMFPYKFIWE